MSRRTVLRSAAGLLGVTAAAGLPAVLAGCRGAGTSPSLREGRTSLGSNYADPVPRAAMAAVIDAFRQATGIDVRVNTTDAQSFQDAISTYLQGTPDDVFTWFAGNRMRFFAAQGLATPLDDIWPSIGDNFAEGVRIAATGDDGRPYIVPFQTYPWVVVHRRSVWAARGYDTPATFEELLELARRMEVDGLIPFAFGDREGWPAMGTFDILDLRLNGYDFHLRLAAGDETWTDPRVGAVFETWRRLLPFHQRGALGRTWQEAAQSLVDGSAGMYFAGTFAAEQADEATRADLDFFAFPALGTAFDDERSIDAPINGFMLSREPQEPAAARTLLEFLAGGEAQATYVLRNPSRIAVALDADITGYTDLQHKMADVIAGAGRIAQFFDRDSRPDFAGPTGMQAFLQDFLADPEQDLAALGRRIQAFWDALP